MAPINILMVIGMKETGQMIFKMVLGLITTQMAISTKDNGLMVSLMGKEIISTMEIRVFIKEIGKTVKNKDSENL